MRLCVPSTKRTSSASQKACQKLLNIRPIRCNPAVCPWGCGGCGNRGRGQDTGLDTSPQDASHTHTDTYSRPHLTEELFRAGYFFLEQAQALMYGNTRRHTENMHDRARSLCMTTSLPSPSQQALRFASSSRFQPGIFLQQSQAGRKSSESQASTLSRLQLRRA